MIHDTRQTLSPNDLLRARSAFKHAVCGADASQAEGFVQTSENMTSYGLALCGLSFVRDTWHPGTG